MRTWTANRHVAAAPEVVLDAICDPESCRRWSPVPFDLDGAAEARLLPARAYACPAS